MALLKNLVISKEQGRVDLIADSVRYCPLGSINCALGNVITMLEEEFPLVNKTEQSDYIIEIVRESLEGKKTKHILEMYERGNSLYAIYNFLDGKENRPLSLKDVEDFRLANKLTSSYLPLSFIDTDKGMQFKNVKNFIEIFHALLYYYAYNGLKLSKCAHCGRWFATTNLHYKYCSRNSTFPRYTHLNCEQAVRNILYNCGRIKNRIETKAGATLSAQLHTNPFIDDFFKQCEPLRLSAKANPTVENLTKYYSFLKTTEKERRWLV